MHGKVSEGITLYEVESVVMTSSHKQTWVRIRAKCENTLTIMYYNVMLTVIQAL